MQIIVRNNAKEVDSLGPNHEETTAVLKRSNKITGLPNEDYFDSYYEW